MAAFGAWSFIRAAAISTRSRSTGTEITAGVGAKLKEVAYAGKAAGIGGMEWMEGIPGAVGGGLRMNAGAMGAQTFENVVRVRYLDADGEAHTKYADELEVQLPEFPFAGEKFCSLRCFPRHSLPQLEEIVRRLEESQEKRRTSQPSGEKRRLHFQKSRYMSCGEAG